MPFPLALFTVAWGVPFPLALFTVAAFEVADGSIWAVPFPVTLLSTVTATFKTALMSSATCAASVAFTRWCAVAGDDASVWFVGDV